MCAIVGLDDAEIGDTICEFDKPKALPPLTIDEPTLDMVFRVNDSPFAEQGRQAADQPRTARPARTRAAAQRRAARAAGRARERVLRQRPRPACTSACLLETIRREGGELTVGKPKVIIKEINGKKHEPFEHLVVEVPNEHVGTP